MSYPPIRLKKGREDDIAQGMPWIYSGDMIESSEQMFLPAGCLVSIENHKGQHLGIGYFNPASSIACRVLALGKQPIDKDFFKARLQKALKLREKIPVPYYRLVHSEADHLPGLLIDRFGDIFAIQVGTLGMENLQPLWMQALEEVFSPKTMVLRNDTSARKLEGLKQETKILKGELPALAEVRENGFTYLADLLKGQKTGWFYDQRDNRKMIADLSKGKSVIDVYSHSGGFGLLASKAGASDVTLVDSSALALELARNAVAPMGSRNITYMQGDAFAVMQELADAGKRYDIVLADPPAFVKSRKDIVAGMKGYEKVARLAAALVKPEGLLFTASCSHHASRGAFNQAVLSGVAKAGRDAKVLKQTGAAGDHPHHPRLPQSEYLKGILLKIE